MFILKLFVVVLAGCILGAVLTDVADIVADEGDKRWKKKQIKKSKKKK